MLGIGKNGGLEHTLKSHGYVNGIAAYSWKWREKTGITIKMELLSHGKEKMSEMKNIAKR